MDEYTPRLIGAPIWSVLEGICAFSDEERHLGHVIQAKGWHAFDATKLNESVDSYRYVGAFSTRREAMEALERSVVTIARPLTMTAH